MRRIVIALLSTVSGVVLLFSYHTSLGQGSPVAAKGTTSGGTTSGGSGGPTAGGTTTSGGPTSGGTSTTSSGEYTGDAVNTRWGPVQVKITVKNGKITAADAVVYPQENPRDVEINSYAVPALVQETVQAQSAKIDSVSGATVTSGGYIASLQSAIDQAHLP
jgi:uncharacterized protein with FMN-binding domain